MDFIHKKSLIFLYKQLSKKFFEGIIICGPNSVIIVTVIHFIWEIEYFFPIVTVLTIAVKVQW